MTPEAVLVAILALPQFHADRATVSPEERVALATPVAEAIVAAAKTRTEVAMLVALADHESAFSAAVIRGACDELPRGSCDQDKTGAYRARGVFQLHEVTCRAAWALPAGSPESIKAEAACAVRLLRWGGAQCRDHALTPIHGAFSVFAGQGCHWSGAEPRVKTTAALLAKWGRS